MRGASISIAQARRVVLAAQGFASPRPVGRTDVRHVRAVIRRLGMLQLDFVNVLVPAHYQVLFSRLGDYPRAALDRAVYGRDDFTEQWAHEASIVPMSTWPLLRFRMARHNPVPHGFEKILRRNPDYAQTVLECIGDRGPLSADQLPAPGCGTIRVPGSWYGSVARAVLEAHFGCGRLAVVRRRANFQRVFDLSERVVPAAAHGLRITEEAAHRQLLEQAGKALGVGTASDLADYYRMPVGVVRPRLQELVESGRLRAVTVEGWRQPAFVAPGASAPANIKACSLLSPFDPLVWHRPRLARLFDFAYRLEIFMPRSQRRWGYYVLPFLLNERLAARVDLRADRARRRLRVEAAYAEPGLARGALAEALAGELLLFASWLGLEGVAVGRRGDLARTLAATIRVCTSGRTMV